MLLLAVLAGCRKEKPDPPEPERVPVNVPISGGLLPSPDSLHGYMYAAVRETDGFSTQLVVAVNGMFGDPARNLISNWDHLNDFPVASVSNEAMPNASVNALLFNGTKLSPSLNFGMTRYESFFSLASPPTVASWKAEGNATFNAFDVTVPGGFPALTNRKIPDTLSTANGFTLNASSFFEEFDSVAVTIRSSFSQPTSFTRRGSPKQPILYFARQEIEHLSDQNQKVIMVLMAFNYAYSVVNDRRYVFELGYKFEKQLSFD